MSDDFQALLTFTAPAQAAFDAMTDLDLLGTWWTSCTGSGAPGGELTFRFDSHNQKRFHVDEATSPSLVRWTCLESVRQPDWVGTQIITTITPQPGGGSQMRFRHQGLTPALECFGECSRGWAFFHPQLVELVNSSATAILAE
jgi:uncharacterized protein YndB with AHSA1/START domain